MEHLVTTIAPITDKKIMTVIFDFDNTLYDTEKRKSFFWEIASVHGYSLLEAYEMYNEARHSCEKITISLEKYLEVLQSHLKRDQKEYNEAAVNDIRIAMEKGDNLLPGARQFVEWCQHQKLACYLLSLGVKEWQEIKFRQADLGMFFTSDRVVYTEDARQGKKGSLQNLFGSMFTGEGATIINDKPDETRDLLTVFPKLQALVRREKRDKRYQKKDFDGLVNDFPDRVVWAESLSAIQSLLAQQI